MRIILSGHSGVLKANAIESIKAALPPNKTVSVYHAEQGIRPEVDLTRAQDLDQPWSASFRKHVIDRWRGEEQPSDVCIITMHLSWYVKSHFFSPMLSSSSANLVTFLREEFQPSHVVCLIDDIFRCQSRMRHHDVSYYFTLGEILKWRNIESILSDALARQVISDNVTQLRNRLYYPFERSPVIAVTHPVSTLLRYVDEPLIRRVYLSYPISEPKRALLSGESRQVEEINHFRHFFSREFTAFDPVTIDELPLKAVANAHDTAASNASTALIDGLFDEDLFSAKTIAQKRRELSAFLEESFLRDAKLRVTRGDVWPRTDAEYAATLSGQSPVDIGELSYREIRGITVGGDNDDEHSELDRQVRVRDFRLIDQSDVVVTYRPTRGKERWSNGTSAEAQYADTTRKGLFVIRDLADPPLQKGGPFALDLSEHNRVEVAGLEEEGAREATFKRLAAKIRRVALP